MLSFIPLTMRTMQAELLVYGSVSRETAFAVANSLESTLTLRSCPVQASERCHTVPQGRNHVFEHAHTDSSSLNNCVDYSLEIGDSQDRSTQAKLLLFDQLIHEPLFNTLRTKEQLGYICNGRPIWDGCRVFYRILVQSQQSCAYIESRIDHFL
jgi:insulysin